MRGDERRVVEAFCAYLTAQGWQVQSEVEHLDVLASRGGQRLLAEAKGRTASPDLDVDTLYGQLLRRITGRPGDQYAVVVPSGAATTAALRVPAAVREALGITVFSIDEQGPSPRSEQPRGRDMDKLTAVDQSRRKLAA